MSIATSEQAVVEKVTPRLFIGGEWREASGGGSFAVEDPSTGEELCQVADATPEDGMAALITAQLLFLESENPKKEIAMYINSPGGIVTSGLAIYDTMQYIKSPVITLCLGMAASMGSFLLMAGEKGQRIALPNSRIMVHQPSGGFSGTASDIERHAEAIIKTKQRLNEIYAKHTGQSIETVESVLDRDSFMTAEEAKDWGIVDHVWEKRESEA